MTPILINNDVFKPGYNELKFSVQNYKKKKKIFLHTFLNWHNSENHTDIMLILAHREKIKRFFYTILKMGCLMRVLAVSLWDKNNYHCISSELNITL